jgi:hypothetical protein
MTIKAFKVDTDTLTLIDRYLKTHPEGQKTIEEAFAKCITTLNEADSGKHSMIEETAIVLLVKPKRDYKKIVTKKYGKKGPYKVSKVIKSFAQKNSGFYNLEGSQEIYPADWFQEVPAKADSSSFLPYLFAIIWGLLLFSGGYALGIMQYTYIFMLL